MKAQITLTINNQDFIVGDKVKVKIKGETIKGIIDTIYDIEGFDTPVMYVDNVKIVVRNIVEIEKMI